MQQGSVEEENAVLGLAGVFFKNVVIMKTMKPRLDCPKGTAMTEEKSTDINHPIFNRRQVFALIIPLMLEQILNSLMGMADTMMVSNVGPEAISAVALVDSINNLLILVFNAMAIGGSIVCAQYLGRRERGEANESARQLVLSTLTISVVIAIPLCLWARPVLSVIFGQVEQRVMDNSVVYMIISTLSYPFMSLYSAGAALMRSEGNSRTPLLVSIVSNVLNIAGNAFLIFVLHLGVFGAALATLASRAFSAVFVMTVLRKEGQAFVIRDYLKIRPDFRRIYLIMSYGIPSGVENGMFQVGKLLIQSHVSAMGTMAIAANTLAATLEGFESNAPAGIGLAMMTIVGQCVGARRFGEAKKHLKVMTVYGEIAVSIMCLMVALLVRPITVLSGFDQETADLTVRLVMIVCLCKPILWAMSFLPSYAFRGAGDVRYPMLVSSISMWLCRVAMTLVLIRVYHMGPEAVWYGMVTDWFARSVVFSFHCRKDKWLEQARKHTLPSLMDKPA